MNIKHISLSVYLQLGIWYVPLYKPGDLSSCTLVVGPTYTDCEGVAVAKSVLEVCGAAQTFESSVDHDGHPGAERLTLLHTVEREKEK